MANELEDIESIIEESKIEFIQAQETKDIKQLTQIAQKLYDNDKKIKELKTKLISENGIVVLCNDAPCESLQFQKDDTIQIQFNLLFDRTQQYQKSLHLWQLQKDDKLLKNESQELYESDCIKSYTYDIVIDDSFEAGKYRIVMHHKQSSGTTKAEKFIEVIKPLDVKPIIVSKNQEAKQSDNTLRSQNDLYIISGFVRSDLSKKINVDVKLIDTKKNETMIEGSFVRPKEDENPEFQPLRFKIPANKLYDDQTLEFEMKLYANEINPIVMKKSFTISSYDLNVQVRDKLTTGDIVNYSIEVPKEFQKPYKINMDPKGGILIAHKTSLTGTIEAINKDNETAHINVQVTDATGKTAKKRVYIDLNVKEQLVSNDYTSSSSKDYKFKYKDFMVYVESSSKGYTPFHKIAHEPGPVFELLLGGSKVDNESWQKIYKFASQNILKKITIKYDNPSSIHSGLLVYELFFDSNGYVTKSIGYGWYNNTKYISDKTIVEYDGTLVVYSCSRHDGCYDWSKHKFSSNSYDGETTIYSDGTVQ